MQIRRLIPEIPVADVQRSVAFYRDVLGFEVMHQDDEFAMLERDEQRLDVSLRDGHGMKLWLVVSDISALHERVQRIDAAQASDLEPRHYWVWEFSLVDPDRTVVMCVQPPPAPGLDIPELFEAIVEGDDDAVADAFAKAPADALGTRGFYWGWGASDRWNTMQLVAGAGSLYALRLALEAGGDIAAGGPAAGDARHWAPLHLAALRNPALVEPMLELEGVSLDACCAAAMGWVDRLAELPLEPGSGGASPLHFAAGRGQAEAVRHCLERGLSVTEKDAFYGLDASGWAKLARDFGPAGADAVATLLRT